MKEALDLIHISPEHFPLLLIQGHFYYCMSRSLKKMGINTFHLDTSYHNLIIMVKGIKAMSDSMQSNICLQVNSLLLIYLFWKIRKK